MKKKTKQGAAKLRHVTDSGLLTPGEVRLEQQRLGLAAFLAQVRPVNWTTTTVLAERRLVWEFGRRSWLVAMRVGDAYNGTGLAAHVLVRELEHELSLGSTTERLLMMLGRGEQYEGIYRRIEATLREAGYKGQWQLGAGIAVTPPLACSRRLSGSAVLQTEFERLDRLVDDLRPLFEELSRQRPAMRVLRKRAQSGLRKAYGR